MGDAGEVRSRAHDRSRSFGGRSAGGVPREHGPQPDSGESEEGRGEGGARAEREGRDPVGDMLSDDGPLRVAFLLIACVHTRKEVTLTCQSDHRSGERKEERLRAFRRGPRNWTDQPVDDDRFCRGVHNGFEKYQKEPGEKRGGSEGQEGSQTGRRRSSSEDDTHSRQNFLQEQKGPPYEQEGERGRERRMGKEFAVSLVCPHPAWFHRNFEGGYEITAHVLLSQSPSPSAVRRELEEEGKERACGCIWVLRRRKPLGREMDTCRSLPG